MPTSRWQRVPAIAVQVAASEYARGDIADGRWMLFSVQPDTTARMVTMISDMQSPSAVRPLMRDGSGAGVPAVSRDGRWVASESSSEVFVRPFPNVDDGRWQVSVGGGDRPNWSHSGQELYYLASAFASPTTDVTIMKAPSILGRRSALARRSRSSSCRPTRRTTSASLPTAVS